MPGLPRPISDLSKADAINPNDLLVLQRGDDPMALPGNVIIQYVQDNKLAVDDTLTNPGAAADAYETGQAIAKLETETGELRSSIASLTQDLSSANAALTQQQKLNADQSLEIEKLKAAAEGNLYMFRQDTAASYEKAVPEDAMKWATLDKIGGRTLTWNQLAKRVNSAEIDGIAWTVTESGAIVASGTATNNSILLNRYWDNIDLKAGHKVYVGSSNASDRDSCKAEFATGGEAGSAVFDDFNIYNSGGEIVVLTADAASVYYSFRVFSGKTVNNIKFYPILVDLTAMFGAGNEPSTPEEFRAMFPADYYPYSEPTLVNFSNSAVVSSAGHSLDTSAIVQKYFPDGMKSAGTVCDEIDWERMMAIQRVGSVDLGTLTWKYSDSVVIFYSSKIGDATKESNTSNIICGKYVHAGRKYQSETDKNISLNNSYYAFENGIIGIRDTAFTDAEIFKSSVAGVIAYYELDAPIETPITEAFDPSIEVESGGTLTFENDQGADSHVPVPNQETFMIKLPGGASV